MKYLIITKGNNMVSFYINNHGYNGYSLKEAIRKYRNDNGLRYKHMEVIDCR